LDYSIRAIEFRKDQEVEARMRRIVRKTGEIVLFVLLTLAVTGIWVSLWLPPH
jgi:hypothetical protein